MAKFKPGQSGNPGGRPKMPADIREARRVTQIELERIINKYTSYTRQEMKDAIADPNTSMFEIMIASIIGQAAQKGDQTRLEFLLNRMIGKVPDKHIATSGEGFKIVMAYDPVKKLTGVSDEPTAEIESAGSEEESGTETEVQGTD